MGNGADAADQLINHSVNATVKVTETATRLTALGAKNLAALLIALAKENHKLSGKSSLTRILSEGKAPAVLNIKLDDMKRFSAEAKKYGVLFTPIRDKSDTSGLCDVIIKQEDISQINRIFERMGYAALKGGEPKNAQSHPRHGKNSEMQENGSKSVLQGRTNTDARPSVKNRIATIKAANGGLNNGGQLKGKTTKSKPKVR